MKDYITELRKTSKNVDISKCRHFENEWYWVKELEYDLVLISAGLPPRRVPFLEHCYNPILRRSFYMT